MYTDFIWNGGSRAFWFPNEDGTYTFVYLDTRTKINAPKVKYVDVRRQKGLLSEGNVKPLQRFGPGEYEKIVPVRIFISSTSRLNIAERRGFHKSPFCSPAGRV